MQNVGKNVLRKIRLRKKRSWKKRPQLLITAGKKLAKPQPKEQAWQNQRGKKTLLSLTLVRLYEET
jgi:hypothetical protein